MVRVIAGFMVVLAVLTPAVAAFAQSKSEIQELRKAVDALRESQERMERDLAEIKGLLRGRPAAQAPPDDEPKDLVLTLDGHAKGDRRARLALVDFTDYQ